MSQKTIDYKDAIGKLSQLQIKELLNESFGEKEAKYHTLDEIPLLKILWEE